MRPFLRTSFFLGCALLAGAIGACPSGGGTARPSTPEDWVARVDSLLLVESHEPALAILDSLLGGEAGAIDRRTAATLVLRRGGIRTALGRTREGEEELREGLRMARECGDSSGLAYGLRWLGVGVDMQARPGEARRLYEELLELGRRSGDRSCEAWGHVGLAWRSLQEGTPVVAIRRYEEAVRLFHAEGNRRGEAWAENGLGIALASEGLSREASRAYRRAGDLARAAGYGLVECMAMNNLGNIALNLGDPGLGAASYERAFRLHLQRGLLRDATIPLINLARCHRLLGSVDDAERCLEEARRLAEGQPDLQGVVLSAMAEQRARQGRARNAAGLYRRALGLGDALPLKNRVECLAGLSSVLAEQDSLPAAFRALASAQELTRGLTDAPLRLVTETAAGEVLEAAGRHGEALAADLEAENLARSLGQGGYRVSILARAARAAHGLGLPDSAIHLYERAALVWESERAVPMDPAWREQRGEDGAVLGTELGRLLLDRPRLDPESTRVRRAFERMQRFKGRTLLERMIGPAAETEPIRDGTDAPFPSLRAIQRDVLGDDDLFLDVYVGPRVSLAFALTREHCRWAELPPQRRIASACEIVRESVVGELGGRRDSLALSSALDAISLWMLEPFRDLIAAKGRLLLSPDGPLGAVPVALVREPASGRPMLDRMECRIVPSARFLVLRKDPARGSTAPEGPETILALAGSGDESGRPLARAAREVRDLERRYRNVSARMATPESAARGLRSDGEGVAGLHIASHVEVNDQSPWQSALCLSSSPESGRITALDVAGMRLPHRLVVLSGCETARGRALNGEGMQGLSAAFLSAGVSCVVASLWPAPDRETAVLMRHFYGGLADGKSAGEAMRAAQMTMRRDPHTRAPVYWSGFLVIGSGEVGLHLQPRRSAVPGIAAAGIGLLLLIALRRGLGRRRMGPEKGL